MASDYLEEHVLIGYYAQQQDPGTPERLRQWSNYLFEDFNKHIIDRATKANLDITLEGRSLMAVLARLSPGNTNEEKAGKAVKAYREYLGR